MTTINDLPDEIIVSVYQALAAYPNISLSDPSYQFQQLLSLAQSSKRFLYIYNRFLSIHKLTNISGVHESHICHACSPEHHRQEGADHNGSNANSDVSDPSDIDDTLASIPNHVMRFLQASHRTVEDLDLLQHDEDPDYYLCNHLLDDVLGFSADNCPKLKSIRYVDAECFPGYALMGIEKISKHITNIPALRCLDIRIPSKETIGLLKHLEAPLTDLKLLGADNNSYPIVLEYLESSYHRLRNLDVSYANSNVQHFLDKNKFGLVFYREEQDYGIDSGANFTKLEEFVKQIMIFLARKAPNAPLIVNSGDPRKEIDTISQKSFAHNTDDSIYADSDCQLCIEPWDYAGWYPRKCGVGGDVGPYSTDMRKAVCYASVTMDLPLIEKIGSFQPLLPSGFRCSFINNIITADYPKFCSRLEMQLAIPDGKNPLRYHGEAVIERMNLLSLNVGHMSNERYPELIYKKYLSSSTTLENREIVNVERMECIEIDPPLMLGILSDDGRRYQLRDSDDEKMRKRCMDILLSRFNSVVRPVCIEAGKSLSTLRIKGFLGIYNGSISTNRFFSNFVCHTVESCKHIRLLDCFGGFLQAAPLPLLWKLLQSLEWIHIPDGSLSIFDENGVIGCNLEWIKLLGNILLTLCDESVCSNLQGILVYHKGWTADKNEQEIEALVDCELQLEKFKAERPKINIDTIERFIKIRSDHASKCSTPKC